MIGRVALPGLLCLLLVGAGMVITMIVAAYRVSPTRSRARRAS